jgi:succinoglycan biosynthesis protein ExoA
LRPDPIRPIEGSPFVSIVAAVRNEAGNIDRCVRALQAQAHPADRLEILIVDGRSSDETRDIVNRLATTDSRIRLLDNPGMIVAAGLNIGIRASRGQVIARMDGHTEAPPDYVSRGLVALHQTGAWCVGGEMRRVGNSPLTRAIAIVTMSAFGVGDASHNFTGESRWVETVFLGMWPRWVFERIGLFDTELVRNQDDELSFRVREAGGKIWLDHNIVMHYEPRASLRRLFSQYRQYGMWKIRVYQKHPRAARPRQLVPPVWVGTVVGGALLGFASPLGWLIAIAAAGSYLAVMSVASRRLAGGGATTAQVLATLVTLHSAYGIGMWQGIIRFAPRWLTRRRGQSARLEPRSAPGSP